MKSTNLLTTKNDSTKRMFGFAAIALVALTVFMMLSGSFGVTFAAQTPATDTLDTVVGTVVNIITTAALYIGIIIVLWGIFQIILALRREDSEGISKQIVTIVVGAVLVGLGALTQPILQALGVNI